jgi:hypothetical protein
MVLEVRPTITESSWEAGENYDTVIRICASLPRYEISTPKYGIRVLLLHWPVQCDIFCLLSQFCEFMLIAIFMYYFQDNIPPDDFRFFSLSTQILCITEETIEQCEKASYSEMVDQDLMRYFHTKLYIFF